jgi:ABC-type multidrug transport system fused ATPase/permease subunit
LTWGNETAWPEHSELVDEQTGLAVRPGEVLVVACTDSGDEEALAERLGRYVDAEVSVDGRPLREYSEDAVRRHILVVDSASTLFGGRLRDELDPDGLRSDDEVARALDVADAHEIVDGLPQGLDTVIGERGRSLSGGQQQRIVVARALLADPPVLVLVEPTSAVDAHTEARIAARLRAARPGRTSVVISASPLLLHAADRAALVVDGRLLVVGDRHEVAHHPSFRAALNRAAIGADAGVSV